MRFTVAHQILHEINGGQQEDFERFLAVFNQFGAVVDLRPLKGKKFGDYFEPGQLDWS